MLPNHRSGSDCAQGPGGVEVVYGRAGGHGLGTLSRRSAVHPPPEKRSTISRRAHQQREEDAKAHADAKADESLQGQGVDFAWRECMAPVKRGMHTPCKHGMHAPCKLPPAPASMSA